MVVVVGLTTWVPPVADREYVLPSVPVMVTEVAFAAVTVSVEEFSVLIVEGLAAMVTVGAGGPLTVTTVLAEVFPAGPEATAVYVVVVAGLTVCDPPVAANVYLLPSDPVIVTCVAFAATTVKVEDAPAAIEEGVAVIVNAGTGFGVPRVPKRPHPVVKKQIQKARMRGT